MNIKQRNRRAPNFESLEARRLLAVYAPLPTVADGDAGSLRAAIAASQSNGEDDTIELSEGIYRLTDGELLVSEQQSKLRILGAGRDSTIIVAAEGSRLLDLDFATTVEIDGVTILRGSAEEGGQVRSAGTLRVSNTAFVGGTARQGGAIFNGGLLELDDVRFQHHQAAWGGAIWNHAGAVVDSSDLEFLSNRVHRQHASGVSSLEQLGVTGTLDDSFQHLVFDRAHDPAGAAIFNSGVFFVDRLNAVQNSSQTGGTITNFGVDAIFDAAKITAHNNIANAHSVFSNVLGQAVVTQSSFFHNHGAFATIVNGAGKLDMFATSIFENDLRFESNFTGALLVRSGQTRLENVSIVSNHIDRNIRGRHDYVGVTAGLNVFNDEDSLLQMTGVLVEDNQRWGDRLTETASGLTYRSSSVLDNGGIWGSYQLHGGNRIGANFFLGFAAKIPGSSDALDVFLEPAESSRDVQDQFQLLQPGIYAGVPAVPPAESSRLIDVLPAIASSVDGDGDGVVKADSGAVEYRAGLDRESGLPQPQQPGLTKREDGPPLSLPRDREVVDVIAAAGSVEFDQQGVPIYQSPADYFGTDQVYFLSSDGAIDQVTIEVLSTPDPPVASDDQFVIVGVNEDPLVNPGFNLGVLDNDSAGNDGGTILELVDFTQPEHGEAVDIEHPLGAQFFRRDFIEYIPAPGFSGIDTLTYTITNAAGENASATVTVEVLDPDNLPPYGELRVEFVDADLRPIDQITVGETLFAELQVENISPLSKPFPDGRSGFQTAAAGLRFESESISALGAYSPAGTIINSGEASPEAVSPFIFAPNETVVLQRNASTVEAYVQTSTDGAEDLAAFFRIPLVANSAGKITAEFDSQIGQLFVDQGILGGNSIGERVPFSILSQFGAISPDQMRFVGDSIEVIASGSDDSGNDAGDQEPSNPSRTPTNLDLPHDVNLDGIVTMNDALIIINELDRLHNDPTSPSSLVPSSSNYMWDVDQNGLLSTKDALQVINYVASEFERSVLEAEFVAAGERLNERRRESSPIVDAPVDQVFAQWDHNRPTQETIARAIDSLVEESDRRDEDDTWIEKTGMGTGNELLGSQLIARWMVLGETRE